MAIIVLATPELRAQPSPPPELPTAGWSNGSFYLRSRDGAFTLIPSARMNIDGFAYAPEFTGRTQPQPTIFIRRLRLELLGSLFHERVDFHIAGDFATFNNGVAATDAYVIFNLHDWAHVQVGQFDVPFTYENRTSDRYIDFMERSFTVRNFGTPNKEPGLMVWGGLPSRLFYYSVGVFNGDGFNSRNLDDAFDVIGRVFVRPLASRPEHPFARFQVGASAAYETRHNTNQPIAPNGWLAIQSGYSFFRTTYQGSDAARTNLGVVPDGHTERVAVELNAPIGRFALRSEFVHVRSDVVENALSTATAVRGAGELTADSAYAQLSCWVIGAPTALPDAGIEAMPRLDPAAQIPGSTWNLQLLLRGEFASVTYRAGEPVGTMSTGVSQSAGDYQYWSAAFGANLWWTRHLRLTLNYALHHFEGASAALPAPGQDLLHEFGARVALSL